MNRRDWDLEALAVEFGELKALDFDLSLRVSTAGRSAPTRDAAKEPALPCLSPPSPPPPRVHGLHFRQKSVRCVRKAGFGGGGGPLESVRKRST